MKELRVVGVRVELPGNEPIVLLKEESGERYVPIWIGTPEANAIAQEQQGMPRPSRPMTHDLIRDVVSALGGTLERVEIVSVTDGLFHAALVFAGGIRVDSRASDAIALALRAEAGVFCDDDVLDNVGILIPEDSADGEDAPPQQSEEEVEKFREFLDTISPDDFAGP